MCHFTDFPGMIAGCNMKCDEQPCKNQGICIEDFQKQEVTCNCERTSFYGELCDEGTSLFCLLCVLRMFARRALDKIFGPEKII
jgi:hypothetical protein